MKKKNIVCFPTQINASNFCSNNKDKANNVPNVEDSQREFRQHKFGHWNLHF